MIFRAEELAARVDMALHDVSAETRRRRDGAFEIYRRTLFQITEHRAKKSLFRNVRGKRIRLHLERRETHAVDRDRIAVTRAFGDCARFDDDACILAAPLDCA